MDSKLSRRILSEARRQQQELEEEHGLNISGGARPKTGASGSQPRATALGTGASSDEEDEDEDVGPDEDICEEIVSSDDVLLGGSDLCRVGFFICGSLAKAGDNYVILRLL